MFGPGNNRSMVPLRGSETWTDSLGRKVTSYREELPVPSLEATQSQFDQDRQYERAAGLHNTLTGPPPLAGSRRRPKNAFGTLDRTVASTNRYNEEIEMEEWRAAEFAALGKREALRPRRENGAVPYLLEGPLTEYSYPSLPGSKPSQSYDRNTDKPVQIMSRNANASAKPGIVTGKRMHGPDRFRAQGGVTAALNTSYQNEIREMEPLRYARYDSEVSGTPGNAGLDGSVRTYEPEYISAKIKNWVTTLLGFKGTPQLLKPIALEKLEGEFVSDKGGQHTDFRQHDIGIPIVGNNQSLPIQGIIMPPRRTDLKTFRNTNFAIGTLPGITRDTQLTIEPYGSKIDMRPPPRHYDERIFPSNPSGNTKGLVGKVTEPKKDRTVRNGSSYPQVVRQLGIAKESELVVNEGKLKLKSDFEPDMPFVGINYSQSMDQIDISRPRKIGEVRASMPMTS